MGPAPQLPVFVYGTLMVPQVLEILLGRVPELRPATLLGYHRYAIEGACYPAITISENSSVDGRLLTGLSSDELATLDAYEGDSYVRTGVSVLLAGTTEAAECYVWRGAGGVALTRADWDLDAFIEHHLQHYLRTLG
jgi:gamma-glutamylcyclotransferase (GGCT)/AIG2-like uncharacterized protein YtfP